MKAVISDKIMHNNNVYGSLKGAGPCGAVPFKESFIKFGLFVNVTTLREILFRQISPYCSVVIKVHPDAAVFSLAHLS